MEECETRFHNAEYTNLLPVDASLDWPSATMGREPALESGRAIADDVSEGAVGEPYPY
jgi:hypothetical protein